MSNATSRLLALSAAGLVAGISGNALYEAMQVKLAVIQTVPRQERKRKEARLRDVFPGHFGYKCGPGWTAAQVKRMAKKRRNIIRNKRSHKGA